jgi:hypothetical protein
MRRREAQQSKQYNDVITLDTYSEEAAITMAIWIFYTLLQNRRGRTMTNQQLCDAFRRQPAILLSNGDKIISLKEGLRLGKKGRYVQKIPVTFNMMTAEKVGVQREYYNRCTMDAVIAHIPDIRLERTPPRGKNGKWGFKASLLPDAEKNAFQILKIIQQVRELPDVPVNFKTELCWYHFHGPIGCVNGGRCHFAHNKAELRNSATESPIQPPARKPAPPATPAPWSGLMRQG